jgi:hypothetical protein
LEREAMSWRRGCLGADLEGEWRGEERKEGKSSYLNILIIAARP